GQSGPALRRQQMKPGGLPVGPRGKNGYITGESAMKSWCPLIALPLVLAGCAGPAHDAPEPLPRHQGEAFTTTMDCGRMTIEVHGDGDGVTVFAAGEEYRMEPAISASGAKYQVAGDQATTFWSKGNNAW